MNKDKDIVHFGPNRDALVNSIRLAKEKCSKATGVDDLETGFNEYKSGVEELYKSIKGILLSLYLGFLNPCR